MFYLYTSLIPFSNVLSFSLYKSSPLWLIPKYFILFDAIVNGIVFVISSLDHSLLVFRNATDFCVLTLYPATLLNSLFSSNRFLVESLGFYAYKIILFANRDNFLSFFPV